MDFGCTCRPYTPPYLYLVSSSLYLVDVDVSVRHQLQLSPVLERTLRTPRERGRRVEGNASRRISYFRPNIIPQRRSVWGSLFDFPFNLMAFDIQVSEHLHRSISGHLQRSTFPVLIRGILSRIAKRPGNERNPFGASPSKFSVCLVSVAESCRRFGCFLSNFFVAGLCFQLLLFFSRFSRRLVSLSTARPDYPVLVLHRHLHLHLLLLVIHAGSFPANSKLTYGSYINGLCGTIDGGGGGRLLFSGAHLSSPQHSAPFFSSQYK